MSLSVVALGLVNAGKSSLLSALAGQYGLFPGGDVPGVTEVVQREERGSLTFIDTPGIDASERHEALALAEARSADVILWCHSLRTGELRPTELLLLQDSLAQRVRPTWLALTHRDEFESDHDARLVVDTVKHQLVRIASPSFPITFVSVATGLFWRSKSHTGHKRELLQVRSKIPQLRHSIDQLVASLEASNG